MPLVRGTRYATIARGSASGFNPLTLNPIGWFDPLFGVYSDARTTPAVDGDPVYRWVSKNSAAVYADQTVLANRPIYRIAANGFGYLDFDGTNDHLVTNITNALGDFTLLAAIRSDGRNFSYERFIDKKYDTGMTLMRESVNSGKWGGGVLNWGSPYGQFVTLADSSWHRIASRRSSTSHLIYGDGGAVSATATVSAAATSADAVYLGAEVGLAAATYFDGRMGHVFLYSSALSDTDLNSVDSYALAKQPT